MGPDSGPVLVDRRCHGMPSGVLIRIALAWVLASAALIAITWTSIGERRLLDPDDLMRLVQVRDLLGGQSWFDLTQYRLDAPGGGVLMHWSRLVDLPLLLVIAALTPLLGANAAETVALVFVPLITMGCAMLLAARIAWRLLGDEEAMLAVLLIAISLPVMIQFAPLRIDHHGWQIVCALAAANGLMARSPWRGGIVIGASVATWLSISIEGLPLAAIIFATLAFRWLRSRRLGDGPASGWLVSAIQSLALVSAALFLTTRGIGDLAQRCDAIGPVHLTMFGWGALALTLLGRFEPVPRAITFAGFGLAGGGAIMLLLLLAPQCATGGMTELDPLVAEQWLSRVREGMPLWHQSLPLAVQLSVPPALGLIAAIRLAVRSEGWLRNFWSDYAIILGAALLVALLVSRAGAVACALAAPPLAWQVRDWLSAINRFERPAPRIVAMLAVICALLPIVPATHLAKLFDARAEPQIAANGVGAKKTADCAPGAATTILRGLPRGEFYALLDIGPHLLLATEHSVIATGHHRGDKGMRFVIETATGNPQAARAALMTRGTEYVAICPGLSESANYSKTAPDGFMALLLKDEAPDWLEPVALPPGSLLRVWRIRPE